MAKAKLKDDKVKLTLTEYEAEVLFRLLGHHITGSGVRETLDGVWYALKGIDQYPFQLGVDPLPMENGKVSVLKLSYEV